MGVRGCDEKFFTRLEEEDFLIFCFGEIDVRCHIDNQIHKEKRDLEEVLDLLVKNYITQIEKISKKYKVHPVIFGITPPVRELIVDGYPSVGSLEDRVKYTKMLNQKLEETGLLYFDVYDEYALDDGSLNMNLSDGVMHIGKDSNQLAKDKLCRLIVDSST